MKVDWALEVRVSLVMTRPLSVVVPATVRAPEASTENSEVEPAAFRKSRKLPVGVVSVKRLE